MDDGLQVAACVASMWKEMGSCLPTTVFVPIPVLYMALLAKMGAC